MVILATIIFGLLLHFQFAQAQPIIYKWTDEKGTVYFTEDPNKVPEKYKNKSEKKDIDEFPPIVPDKSKRPQSYSGERPSSKTERTRPVKRIEKESVDSGPSPGYIPFEKFKYVTKGMTEAEVLSRFGPPTREEESEVKSKGTITGHVSPGGALSGGYHGQTHTVKRYYYIGDRSKGEQTRIIIFEKGKVVDYKSITP